MFGGGNGGENFGRANGRISAIGGDVGTGDGEEFETRDFGEVLLELGKVFVLSSSSLILLAHRPPLL